MHKALSAARDQALGRAVISLRTCFQAVGVEQDDWFPLEDAGGRACGEVRLELAYFVDADDDFPEDDSDDEAAGGGEPNMVRGTICRARGLRHPDRAGPVDAYCTVRVGRHKASTATVRRSNGPLFDHAFELPCGDGAACVRVKVKARAAQFDVAVPAGFAGFNVFKGSKQSMHRRFLAPTVTEPSPRSSSTTTTTKNKKRCPSSASTARRRPPSCEHMKK